MDKYETEKKGEDFCTMKPFAEWITSMGPDKSLKIPSFKAYSGSESARDHMASFEANMSVLTRDDDILCKALLGTLTGPALAWFRNLKPGSINDWPTFRKLFLENFATAGYRQARASDLAGIQQEPRESTLAYLERFRAMVDKIDYIPEGLLNISFTNGLLKGTLRTELTVRPPVSRSDLYERAYSIASVEEPISSRLEDRDYGREGRGESSRKGSDRKKSESSRSARDVPPSRGFDRQDDRRPEAGRPRIPFTPLTVPRKDLISVLNLGPPQPMKESSRARRNPRKYCAFHRDIGHDTEDCEDLQRVIQRCVDEGKLDRYIKRDDRGHDRGDRDRQDEPRMRMNVINVEVPSNTQLNKHIYSLKKALGEHSYAPQGDMIIGFSRSELPLDPVSSEEPLIITARIDNCEMTRVLVDTGAAKNVLYYKTFKEMGLPDTMLRPYPGRLEGFTNHKVEVKGEVDLSTELGERDLRTKGTVTFSVIDLVSEYHAILGIPIQAQLGMVASVPHQKVKFPTPKGVGCVRSSAREYWEHVVKQRKQKRVIEIETPEKSVKISRSETWTQGQGGINTITKPVEDVLPKARTPRLQIEEIVKQEAPGLSVEDVTEIGGIIIETLQIRDGLDIKPNDDLEEVVINEAYPDQRIKLGRNMEEKEREEVCKLLRQSLDVFAWRVEDMKGVRAEVATHKLMIDPGMRPVKQKLRVFSNEKEGAIKEEIQKLLKAGIIKEVYYPTWLANVVMVKKANGKWRMCVDFTDLNKACPKDCYPLPRIDKLVDSISGHRMLSFLDAYSGYHQVRMDPKDSEATAFQAGGGTYCYTMMPFGLKNAGATYQRMVNKVFEGQIGRNVEAYVDDMVIKTKEGTHAKDLAETFENLRAHQMKLNPSKCVFGVTAGKFLGFMVSERGIEANPEKIQALVDMKEPTTVKEMQRLNGRVAALGRFIAKSAERSLPFFKALRGAQDFVWTEECAKAFGELKEYLGRAPLLSSPVQGDTLHVYLSVSDTATAAVLTRMVEKDIRPVYYVSKVLAGPEVRYYELEKAVYALVIASRKLRAYFSAHPIIVHTNLPLRKVLHKPDSSGRLLKWAIELTEFDITYEARPTLQAQPLVDFLAETTFTESERG